MKRVFALAVLAAALALPSPSRGADSRGAKESVDVRLLKAEADLRSSAVRIRELQGRIQTLEADRIAAELAAEERRRRMSTRLRIMYRLRHRGFLPLLFSADSPHELLRSARYLWWIVRSDQGALADWEDSLERSQEETDRIAEEREALLLAAGEAAARREEALAEREVLTGSRDWTPPSRIDDGDGGPPVVAHRVLRRERVWLSEEQREELPVHKREIVAEAAAPEVVLDLSNERPPELPTEELKPAAPFERSRGLLSMPALGNIVRSGRGVAIEAAQGDPIRVVHGGDVARILWIRGFGNVCIVDHGDGWHSIYGHAEEFTVQGGQWVDSGAVIGTVGATGSLEGPRLHFEVRKDRVAEDPLDWLKVPPGLSRPR